MSIFSLEWYRTKIPKNEIYRMYFMKSLRLYKLFMNSSRFFMWGGAFFHDDFRKKRKKWQNV